VREARERALHVLRVEEEAVVSHQSALAALAAPAALAALAAPAASAALATAAGDTDDAANREKPPQPGLGGLSNE